MRSYGDAIANQQKSLPIIQVMASHSKSWQVRASHGKCGHMAMPSQITTSYCQSFQVIASPGKSWQMQSYGNAILSHHNLSQMQSYGDAIANHQKSLPVIPSHRECNHMAMPSQVTTSCCRCGYMAMPSQIITSHCQSFQVLASHHKSSQIRSCWNAITHHHKLYGVI